MKKVFEDDILDLLGLRRNTPELYRPGYMFSRLIYSILIGRKKSGLNLEDVLDGEKAEAKDFRLILIDLLQQVVNDKVRISLPSVIDRAPDARKNVLNDLDTARGWTKMLGHLINRDVLDGAPRRTFDFDTNRLLSKKARK